MKKSNFSVMLAAVAAVFILSAQAQAYSVSGNVANPGDYATGGSLWAVLQGASIIVDSGVNSEARDYVLITGSSGSVAFSGGELYDKFSGRSASLVSNGSGFDLESWDSRDLTNVSSIELVHAITYAPSGTSGTAGTLTVSGPGIATASYTGAQLNGFGLSTVTSGTIVGPSLQDLLGYLGADTTDLNLMVIARATDGYSTVVSMGEAVGASASLPVMVGFNAGTSGFARLKVCADSAGGRGVKNLASLEVIDPVPVSSVPVPASLLLFAPGLLGLVGLRKRNQR